MNSQFYIPTSSSRQRGWHQENRFCGFVCVCLFSIPSGSHLWLFLWDGALKPSVRAWSHTLYASWNTCSSMGVPSTEPLQVGTLSAAECRGRKNGHVVGAGLAHHWILSKHTFLLAQCRGEALVR